MQAISKYWVFEYMYRDGANWKTHGALLLVGELKTTSESVCELLESGDLFVAEQVGVPPLCEKHWEDCGEGPSHLDHAYHEFLDLRPANSEEIAALPVAGQLSELMGRLMSASGRWDVRLSRNCEL